MLRNLWNEISRPLFRTYKVWFPTTNNSSILHTSLPQCFSVVNGKSSCLLPSIFEKSNVSTLRLTKTSENDFVLDFNTGPSFMQINSLHRKHFTNRRFLWTCTRHSPQIFLETKFNIISFNKWSVKLFY